jgi:hypothetical protein
MMRALNALHYPSQARQQKRFHQGWTACAGWCVGVGMAWGWQHWQELQTVQLQQTHKRLQSDWDARKAQAQDAAWRQNQGRQQQAKAVHLQQIAEHQQAWVALHDRLLHEAASHGLQLARLQVEAGKIELQGSLKRWAEMAEVRQGVSAHLPQALTMSRMTTGLAQDGVFVWQAAWPAAQASDLTSPAPKTDAPSAATLAAAVKTP